MRMITKSFLTVLSVINLSACSLWQANAQSSSVPRAVELTQAQRESYEAMTQNFVIASQGVEATRAAKEVYATGGNIIDAAIAASFVISVERPQSTGLGGGGFLLFRDGKSKDIVALDFRERAPLKAYDKMFLDEKGEVIKGRSTEGIFSVGTPGLVKGLWELHKKFGRKPWADLVQPAIRLAKEGVVVYAHLATAIESQKELLAQFPASAKIFLKADGSPYVEGERLVQSDLAKTLEAIAEGGAEVFYSGPIARQIVAESRAHQGLLNEEDLKRYQVKWRAPVKGTFKGYEIASFPPPSSGGVHVIEILNVLENDDLKSLGFFSPSALHLTSAAMQFAFADRANFLGDPDFVNVPSHGLTSKAYAAEIRKKIPAEKALKSDQVASGNAPAFESSETTNFSMIDREGNAVVSTQTVNGYLGSGIVVTGAGFLLNNEMDDFSAKPGAANQFGAVGGTPNAVAPQKTPLSSMSPTLVLKGDRVALALGAPGGTRIITCVAQTILNYLEFQLPLYESVASLRFHHQWKPDELLLESPGPSPETKQELENLGYVTKVGPVSCKVNAVATEEAGLRGVADPRDLGAASGF